MATIFPIIDAQETAVPLNLPLYKTVAWDFQKKKPIFKNGNPVYVVGVEGLKVWCWLAIMTQRTRYEIYSWNFGSEVEELIGQGFTKDLKKAEAIRYIEEAILINPYITGVSETSVDFLDGSLTIYVKIHTIYGEVSFDV